MCYLSQPLVSRSRSHLRRDITSEKKKLTNCVQKYNDLCTEDANYCATTISAVIDGDFPWSLLTGQAAFTKIKCD